MIRISAIVSTIIAIHAVRAKRVGSPLDYEQLANRVRKVIEKGNLDELFIGLTDEDLGGESIEQLRATLVRDLFTANKRVREAELKRERRQTALMYRGGL